MAIRLDEETTSPAGATPAYDPSARLSQNIEHPQDDSLLSLLSVPPPHRRSNTTMIAKSLKIAGDRVNCITLWFAPTLSSACDEAYNEPVAVLANNDKTVAIVSLIDFDHYEKTEPLEIITYPDYVNRATISPDGHLLIAILDDAFLYIHKRVAKSSSRRAWGEDSEYQWEEVQRILLKSQSKSDETDSRGSFAACFSSSGAYLAVGTQHGTISIFDAALLTNLNADPLVTTFESSRPNTPPGAVRDMKFCPGPYDILAWTEDRGRIGVADMRSNFKVRQIIDINVEVDFQHVNILDRNNLDPQLVDALHGRVRGGGNRGGSGHNASSTRETESFEILNRPLTANETTVLDAIRSERRRNWEMNATRTMIRNATDRSTADASNAPSSSRSPAGEADPPRQRSGDVLDPSRAVADLLGSRRVEQDRNTDRYRYYRTAMRDNNSQLPTTRRTSQQGLMDRINETVEAMRDQRRPRDRTDSSYLSVLEILQGRGEEDLGEDDRSLLVPFVNQVRSQWEDSGIRGTLGTDHNLYEVPPKPDNTAGLAWSDDGRTL